MPQGKIADPPSGSVEMSKMTFELRTELDSIIGLAELLAEELTTDESWALEDLHRIKVSAHRVGEIVARLEEDL